MTRWNHRWTAILGVSAAIILTPALLFRRVLFGSESLFGRDITPFFYPMKHFMVEAVRGGTLPLWNPGILNGEPFFATLQPGLLYPGSWLLFLTQVSEGLDWLTYIHYPIAGAGIYLLLRRWETGRAGATLGAVAFTVGGYLASVGNFTNNLQTVAWLPWIFWTWARYLDSGSIRAGLWFALACALAFLGGEPQMLALGAGLAILHGLLRVEPHDTDPRRQFRTVAGAGLLVVGLVAVQLLPFLELLGHSVRTLEPGLGFSASRTLTPQGLLHLLLPPALEAGTFGFTGRYLLSPGFSWLVSVFPGSAVVAFAILGAAFPSSRRWAAFWIGAAAFGLAMALGPHTLIYPALYDIFPPLRLVRYPEKFFFLTALAIAVLSGRGLDRWLAGEGRRSILAVVAVVALVPIAGAVGPRLGTSPLAKACASFLAEAAACGDIGVAEMSYAVIGGRTVLLLSGLGIVLIASRHLSRTIAAGAVIGLAAVELGLANAAVNPSVPAEFYQRASWAEEAVSDGAQVGGTGRTYRYRATPLSAEMGKMVTVNRAWELSNLYLYYETAGPNIGQTRGLLLQDGLQGVELKSVARMFTSGLVHRGQAAGRLLRATSVRYYADPTPLADSLSDLQLAATHPELPLRIWEVEDPLPRAYLVDEYVVETNADSAFRRVLNPGFPLEESVILDRAPVPRPTVGAEGRVVAADYGLNRVELEVRADGKMLLVLTDRHYPGWRAEVDERRVPIRLANGHFRAVSVPEGHHRVVYEYRPIGFTVGGWISGVSGLLFGLALFLGVPGSGRPESDSADHRESRRGSLDVGIGVHCGSAR